MIRNANFSKGKWFSLIPIGIFIIFIFAFCVAFSFEMPSEHGLLYSGIAFFMMIISVLAPLSSLVSSILGVIYSSKAKKGGFEAAAKYKKLAVVEIIVSIICLIAAVILAFTLLSLK